MRHLEPFAFFDVDALGDRVEFLHLAELIGDEGRGRVRSRLPTRSSAAASRRSRRSIVIDSSKALHDVVEPDEFRRAIYDLASKVAYSDAVLILVGEYSAGGDALATGVRGRRRDHPARERGARADRPPLAARPEDARRRDRRRPAQLPHQRRRLRGVPAPRDDAARVACPTLDGRAPRSALEKLDDAIGGGIPRGDSTLLIGPSGVGKTLLALRFIAAGLEQGERCLHLSFQENETQVREKAAAAGWDWADVRRRSADRPAHSRRSSSTSTRSARSSGASWRAATSSAS